MKSLKKPSLLRKGDKVALVSLSSGLAGDEGILWRYKQGKKRLEYTFGLNVIEMEHTLAGMDYIYEHPEKRAEDLLNAFRDPSIKGIISCIGGNESIRMLPFIDFDVISKNPKVFMGYSDTTISHLICFKAGISSIYGPALLTDFAENVAMHQYTTTHINKTIFTTETIGEVSAAYEWTSEYLPWEEKNKLIQRKYRKNSRYELIQGTGIATGRLLGGCLEVFDLSRGTSLFPTMDEFKDAILFFETSEDKPPVWYVETVLRTYGMMGIFNVIKGILWGKPQEEAFIEEYKEVILKIMREFGREDLPILYNMNFGHTEPKICLPYGALARLNCDKETFTILDSGVI